MKNKKSIQSYLFTPFRYIAGVKSLIYGGIVLLVLSGLSYLTQTAFDGVLDIHYGCLEKPESYLTFLSCILISWASVVIVLYITSLIFSRSSVRFTDIAGTTAMAKYPLIFAALWGFMPFIHLCFDGTTDANALMVLLKDNAGWIILTGLIAVPIIAWVMFLTYHAFSVSANLKGKKGVILFIIGILIGEIISKVLIYFIFLRA